MRTIPFPVTDDKVADEIEAALDDPTKEILWIILPFDKSRPLDPSSKNKLVNEAANMARELLRKYE